MTEPLTDDHAAILQAGLRWLYETDQPQGAILQHHGETLHLPEANRSYRFIPSGDHREVIVVVDVARVRWVDVDPWTREAANPLDPDELDRITVTLASLGAQVVDTWNGHPAVTGSLRLAQPAHPTLLAAVDLYYAGRTAHLMGGGHGDVFCDCGWYQSGNARVVRPTAS